MTGKAGARFEAVSQETGSVVLICPAAPEQGRAGHFSAKEMDEASVF
jgi:hypothetical protein